MGGVAWTEEEDHLLRKCIEQYGEGKWHRVPLLAGLNRCRKSCRLRWLNYLRPNIRRGRFTEEEVELIIKLHKLLGNRWSLIAGRLPGRTANDVKNVYWNGHLSKKLHNVNNNNINHDEFAAAPAADHKQQITAEKAAAVVLEVMESPWAPQLQNCISAAAAGADPTVVYEPAEPPQDAGSTSKETPSPSCGLCKSGFFDRGGDDVVTVFHELEAAGRDHGDHDQDYNYKLLSCMEAGGHGQDDQELQVDFELEEINVMGEAGQSTKHKWDLDYLMDMGNMEQLWSLHSL
ncbi:hypothetical protein Dimus_011925 [Dionaea muscipula]